MHIMQASVTATSSPCPSAEDGDENVEDGSSSVFWCCRPHVKFGKSSAALLPGLLPAVVVLTAASVKLSSWVRAPRKEKTVGFPFRRHHRRRGGNFLLLLLLLRLAISHDTAMMENVELRKLPFSRCWRWDLGFLCRCTEFKKPPLITKQLPKIIRVISEVTWRDAREAHQGTLYMKMRRNGLPPRSYYPQQPRRWFSSQVSTSVEASKPWHVPHPQISSSSCRPTGSL